MHGFQKVVTNEASPGRCHPSVPWVGPRWYSLAVPSSSMSSVSRRRFLCFLLGWALFTLPRLALPSATPSCVWALDCKSYHNAHELIRHGTRSWRCPCHDLGEVEVPRHRDTLQKKNYTFTAAISWPTQWCCDGRALRVTGSARDHHV